MLGAAAVLAVPAAGQPIDQELRDLIPDEAVANPEGWATSGADRVSAPAGQPDPAPGAPGEPALPAPDPGSPLAEHPGITVPWPDAAPAAPELAAVPPEADAEAVLAEARAVAPLSPDLTGPAEEVRLSDHLTLVFPANLANFPERAEFLDRFRTLSTLERLDTDEDSIAQITARARADKTLIEDLLRLYGYYDATIWQTIGNGGLVAQPQTEVAVRFAVVPGVRYRFGTVVLGDLPQTGPDYPVLRDAVGISPGDQLDNGRIVAGRNALDTRLGETGYAFAKVGDPDLLVDHKRQEGDLSIPTVPGGKFRFGPIVSRQPAFLSSRHLQHIARFRPGEVYRRSDQEDLKRAILATGLVSSVTVTPRQVAAPPGPGQTGEAAIDVAMVPGPLRTIAGLAGYESGDGFRLEGSWEHRNLLPPEGMVRVRGIAGTKEQLLGTTVRWNNFRGRDRVLTLDLYANTVDRDAFNARTLAFSAVYEKLTTLFFQKPWTWSVGLEILASGERESSVAGQYVPRNTYFIAALPSRGAFDFSDNLLDPRKGWRAALSISPEVSKQQDGPTARYARVQFDLSGYVPASSGVVLAARARVGTIPGAPLADIAPSRRYYAGGGGPVRGYGYQAIGPRDTAGAPSGGRSLVELSAEARIDTGLFDDSIQIVPFVDAGTVSDSIRPTLSGLRYGAGLGLRYKTGFGPLRLDVGTPLNPRPGDSRITVSIALGQAF